MVGIIEGVYIVLLVLVTDILILNIIISTELTGVETSMCIIKPKEIIALN